MAEQQRPAFVPIGSNAATLFGMDATARACRLARNAGLTVGGAEGDEGPTVFADMAFAWDPAWLSWIAERPGTVLSWGGKPVLVHAPAERRAEAAAALGQGTAAAMEGFALVPAETAELSYGELRKRERPFVMPLSPQTSSDVERAAYDAAYKGVTDALTLYLWREPAFHLTRWAAQRGLTPNMVTAVGAALCLLAFWLFWIGAYWPGIAAGFAFMVLDTVDGKLARCTGTSSKWGNVFDHGIDLVHPLFWYWAWAEGLERYGTPLEPVYATMLLATLALGYVAQRAIEGVFLLRFGMHIHVWRPADSRFRLITARRNPNMVLLVAGLVLARPDVGLELVTLWTVLSLIFHAVRLTQAEVRRERGEPVRSWLD
jgi:phosphatidylglycerophosphate synthase